MSTTTASPRTRLCSLVDREPAAQSHLVVRPTLPPSNQPPLDLSDHETGDRAEDHAASTTEVVRVSTVRARVGGATAYGRQAVT